MANPTLKYFKFNNSRSKKNPFWIRVYTDLSNHIIDTCGTRWMINNTPLIPITKSEFDKVQKSISRNYKIGDKVIIIGYESIKNRFGIIADIVDINIPLVNASWTQIVLTDGRVSSSEYVVTTDFIFY